MPRKKTIELPPLFVGENYEVRDRTCPTVGKGSHSNMLFNQIELVRCWLFYDNDFPNISDTGEITLPDYLTNSKKFDDKLVLNGMAKKYGLSQYTIRRRIYPQLMEEIHIYNYILKKQRAKVHLLTILNVNG